MFYDFWLKVGTICKDISIPIMILFVLVRLYIYIGCKAKVYMRALKFYDTFMSGIEEIRKGNAADIINFNKNKE